MVYDQNARRRELAQALGNRQGSPFGAAPQPTPQFGPPVGVDPSAAQGIGQALGQLLGGGGASPPMRGGFSEGGMMEPVGPPTSAPGTSVAPPVGPSGLPAGPAGGPGAGGNPGPTNPPGGVPINPGPMPQVAGPQGGIPPGLAFGPATQSVPPEMLAMILQRFAGRGKGV